MGVAKQKRDIQVFTQEIGETKNPLDDFYKAKSSNQFKILHLNRTLIGLNLLKKLTNNFTKNIN